MGELVADGYELVSVVGGQSRTYFLRKQGKLAKCDEVAQLDGPLPVQAPITKGQRAPVINPADLPKVHITTECDELVRPLR
jgi:hypothetical protein